MRGFFFLRGWGNVSEVFALARLRARCFCSRSAWYCAIKSGSLARFGSRTIGLQRKSIVCWRGRGLAFMDQWPV